MLAEGQTRQVRIWGVVVLAPPRWQSHAIVSDVLNPNLQTPQRHPVIRSLPLFPGFSNIRAIVFLFPLIKVKTVYRY